MPDMACGQSLRKMINKSMTTFLKKKKWIVPSRGHCSEDSLSYTQMKGNLVWKHRSRAVCILKVTRVHISIILSAGSNKEA